MTGTLSAFEAANLASAKVQGQDYNPFTAEHIAGVAASVLPFEAAGVYGDIMGKEKRPGEDHLNALNVALKKQAEARKVFNTNQLLQPGAEVKRMERPPRKGKDRVLSLWY